MKRLTGLCSFHRQVVVLGAVLACATLWGASASHADTVGPAQPVAPASSATERGTVKGDRSNVRSRPSLHSEVVAQLRKGETVDVLEHKTVSEREKSMDWLRVALPPSAKCYVSAKHLTDGTVNVEDLNVRCGPGSSYREVGKLPKGTRVDVVGKKGDWAQIQPTTQCSGWVAAELVQVEVVPPPAPAASASPSEIVTPAVAAPAVSVVNTDPDVLVTYAVKDGYLWPVNEPNAPAPFELRTPIVDRISFRVAYLEAPEMNLTKFEGKHVRLVGTQRWKKGDRYPVITVERIDMVW